MGDSAAHRAYSCSIALPGCPQGKASGDSTEALTVYSAPTLGKACHVNAAGSWGMLHRAVGGRRLEIPGQHRCLEVGAWEG